ANEGDAAPTLELTATASDGTTEKAYTLTFIKVSVDATVNSIVVTGVETSNTFASNDDQAEANDVDYYYMLIGETQKKATVAITPNHNAAAVAVGWTDTTLPALPDYASTVEYSEGEYTITITAEAGNTKTYTFVLAAALYLKLADGSSYQFLTEREEDEEEFYRRAYDEIGWKHGVDDLELETVVLGQISQNTTVNEFLENIDSAQLSMLKIYDQTGAAVYLNGQPADGIAEEEFDDIDSFAIGTGWRVEYGTDESADVVYISVLGDVDGDGAIASFDVADINYQIMGRDVVKAKFAKVYIRLACYVENEMGSISSFDVAILNYVIMGKANTETYFYKPAVTPAPEA
ncbi:MAG: hypothetical protein K2N74_03635, partial [Clostridiales bacterium]|nr:hypothetical protein [Clostridiales bacterium]